jgi:hypothetical protein
MLLFFVGFLCAIFIGNIRELLAQLFVCALLLLTIISPLEVATARLLDFIFPFIAFFAVYPIFSLFSSLAKKGLPSTAVNIKVRFKTTRNFTNIIIPFLCFLVITSPFLTYSINNFINYHETKGLPLQTFNQAEYEACTYIKQHFSSNVLIISDTFSTLLVTGLSGNPFTTSFRITYDEKGNTHPLAGDGNYLLSVRNLLETTNQSEANESFSQIRETIDTFNSLNQKIGTVTSASDVTFLVVLSGRTSVWLNQESTKDVVYPQSMAWLPGYQKFLESSSYHLLYQTQNEVFIIEISTT